MIAEQNPRRLAGALAAIAVIGLTAAPLLAADYAVAPGAAIDPATGIALPAGFSATIVADGLGMIRHLAVRDNGDIYTAMQAKRDRGRSTGGGVMALRDGDGDGRAEIVERFGSDESSGLALHGGYLYASSNTAVYRYRLEGDALVPAGAAETLIGGFPEQRQHAAKSMAFDGAGHIYVNVGGPSNACQISTRTPGSPGHDPCPQLERQGGIWRFDADRTGQTQEADGHRFASGIRNSVALDWNQASGRLYVVQHGRDQLQTLWPDLFDAKASAVLPSEEFLLLEDGGVYGWPYTYYNHLRGERMAGPEYGGDGKTPAEAGKYPDPIATFPGHWAPNDLLFYSGGQFPDFFANGAFIAFHGSWNRAPEPQDGYRVVFVPFDGALPSGPAVDFATGFPGVDPVVSPGDAKHRPMGLAQGPDGALYVSDDAGGRIWRVTYNAGH